MAKLQSQDRTILATDANRIPKVTMRPVDIRFADTLNQIADVFVNKALKEQELENRGTLARQKMALDASLEEKEMGLKAERQRQEIDNDAKLAIQRAGYEVKLQDDRRNAEKRAVEDAARVDLGADEFGRIRPLPQPAGGIYYAEAYERALGQRYQQHFSLGLTDSLNQIQVQEQLSAQERKMRMRAAVEGKLSAVPERYRADAEREAFGQIERRSSTMFAQESERNRKLAVEDLGASIEMQSEEAASRAAAGLDFAPQLNQIRDRYKTLVDMGAMSPLQMERGIAKTGEEIQANFVSRAIHLSVDDPHSPADGAAIHHFGVMLEGGGGAELQMPNGLKLKTGQVTAAVRDPQLRAQLARNIQQLGASILRQEADHAKEIELGAVLSTLGEHDVLPSRYRDDYDKLVDSRVLGQKLITDPDVQPAMLDLIARTKVVPKTVSAQLHQMAFSADPQTMMKAAGLHQTLTTLTTKSGKPVGETLVGVEDRTRFALETISAGLELGFKPEEIRLALQQSQDVSVRDVVAGYNATKPATDPTFQTRFRQEFSRSVGIPAEKVTDEVIDKAGTAYHLMVSVLKDRGEAFDQTVKRLSRRYVASPVFLDGYAINGGETFTNPDGYVAPRSKEDSNPLNPASVTKGNEWLDRHLKEQLWANFKSKNSNLELDQKTMDELLPNDKLSIGSTLFIHPTSTDPTRPQYTVWLKRKDGSREQVMTHDGPLLVDPVADLQHERSERGRDKAALAIDEGADERRQRLLMSRGWNPFVGIEDGTYQKLSFDEWLGTLDKGERQRLDDELKAIDAGARRSKAVLGR